MMRSLLWIVGFLLICACQQPENTRKGEVVIWQKDVDTTTVKHKVLIGNELYDLYLVQYCLNDSAIVLSNEMGDSRAHNYEVEMTLGSEKDTLLVYHWTKTAFEKGFPSDFFEKCVLWEVKYDFIRSNRLYFNLVFTVPDTDWMMKTHAAIFYKTNKKGQLDYWDIQDNSPEY